MTRRTLLLKAHGSRTPGQAGFSFVELLVTIVIMAEILIGVAILFDSSNRLARSQTHLAELQQSLRVGQSELVRYVRMAGIGGLPITRLNPEVAPDSLNPDYDQLGAFPRSGYAVSVINNTTEDDIVKAVDPTSSEDADGDVLSGSDVLVLRGVLTTPLYYFDPPVDITGWLDDGELANASVDQLVTIQERVRIVGDDWEDYPQDISALSERLIAAKARTNALRPVAMMIRDTLTPNAYAVMEFDHANTTNTMLTPSDCPSIPATASYTPQCIQLYLRLDVDSTPGEEYGDLSTGTILQAGAGGITVELDPAPDLREVEFPNTIGSIGLLEEYRFFVRQEYEIPGVDTSRLAPVLSRARFLPGTDVQIDRVDIADNVIDLQIAVGADSQEPGAVGYGEIAEILPEEIPDSDTDGYIEDEVLFNALGDTEAGTGNYSVPPGTAQTWYDPALEFHFLRINTLVQSRFPDPRHLAPGLGNIEDFNRGATVNLGSNRYNDDIRYHRRWLQTVVELRNLL